MTEEELRAEVQRLTTYNGELRQGMLNLQAQFAELSQAFGSLPVLARFGVGLPKPRANAPEGYDPSKKTDVDTWLFEMESFFALYPALNGVDKVRNAATFFKGSAAIWWRHLSLTSDILQRPDPWAAFLDAMRSKWRSTNPVRAARDKIFALKQTGSVEEYTHKFLDLKVRISNMSEDEASDKYVRGLKQSIRVECLKAMAEAPVDGTLPLESLIRLADSMDSVEQSARRPFVHFHPSVTPDNGPAPMELGYLGENFDGDDTHSDGNLSMGAMGQRPGPRLSPEEKERRRSGGLCYKCASPAHVASQCPLYPKRQVAALKTKLQEWAVGTMACKGVPPAAAPQSGRAAPPPLDHGSVGKMVNDRALTTPPRCYPSSLYGRRVSFMVDSGADGNFISKSIVEKLGEEMQESHLPGTIQYANGHEEPLGGATAPLTLRIGGVQFTQQFIVLELNSNDIILGQPWLRRWNPQIDWRCGTLTLEREGQKLIIKPLETEAGQALMSLSVTCAIDAESSSPKLGVVQRPLQCSKAGRLWVGDRGRDLAGCQFSRRATPDFGENLPEGQRCPGDGSIEPPGTKVHAQGYGRHPWGTAWLSATNHGGAPQFRRQNINSGADADIQAPPTPPHDAACCKVADRDILSGDVATAGTKVTRGRRPTTRAPGKWATTQMVRATVDRALAQVRG